MKYFTINVPGETLVSSFAQNSDRKLFIIQLMRIGFVSVAIILTSLQLLMALPAKSQRISTVEIKLELKNETLLSAFKKIEHQTDFRFVYKKGELLTLPSRSISASTYTVEQALNLLLANTELSYKQVDNNVLIVPKRPQFSKPDNTTEAEGNSPVSGKVIDVNGEALIGVSVRVKGSQVGVSTDIHGNFTLDAPENSILVFTYIGFISQESVVRGATVNVTMVEDRQSLKEVVVTALGVTKAKRGLGYAVQEVRGEEFTEARMNNVASALTGKIAGVDATQIHSGAGGSSRVIIRGNTSLNGNQQPLYVVDGMPIDNSNRAAGTNSALNVDRGDGISSMNPDDIATISVLKGGAAAALYGSQAANGVILITTKKGSIQNGVGIEVTSDANFGSPSVFPNYQYVYGQGNDGLKPATAAAALSSGRISFGEKMDGSMVLQFDGVKRPYSPVNVKDNIKSFYQTSQSITNTVAFSGGSQSLRMRLSLSDLRVKDQVPNSEFFRKTANLNVSGKMGKNDFVTIESSVQYNLVQGRNRPGVGLGSQQNTSWPVQLAANVVNVEDMRGTDPNRIGINAATGMELEWNPVPASNNPYYVAYQLGNQDDLQRLIARASVQFNVLRNLFIKGTVARDYSDYSESSYMPMTAVRTPLGTYNSGMQVKSKTNYQAIVNYNQRFLTDKVGFNLLAGTQRERDSFRQNNANGSQWVLPDFYTLSNLVNRDLVNISEGIGGTNSVFGEANIDYNNILYLTVTGRQDWFSVLNRGFNSIFYPSVGASFILSDVVKMPEFLNYAKLRSSWAEVGSATVSAGSINRTYEVNTVNAYGRPTLSNPNTLQNPNIRPVTVSTIEGGFELQMLNSRLGLDVNYYSRRTRDDILTPPITAATGYAAGRQNMGLITNKGLEISLNGTPIKNDNFSWGLNYNLGYNQSKIVELAEGIDVLSMGGNVINAVGLPYSTIRAYVMRRNAEGTLVYNKATGYEDRVLADLGVGNPPYLMGLSNNFRYKAFSLTIDIDSKFGAVAFSQLSQYTTRFGLAVETLAGRENGLTVAGVDQTGAPFTTIWPVINLDTYYDKRNDYPGEFVYKTDFVKLRRAVLKYNLPVSTLKFLRVQSASVGITGLNLAILYQDKKVKDLGIDPEMQETVGNDQGSSAGHLPHTRNIGFNLNLRF